VCRGSVECVESAGSKKAFQRALRGKVTDSAIATLRERVAERARIEGRGSVPEPREKVERD
jgi:predicted RNA-binding protein YlxR (DUF448 family)